jgi:hypothetical protein
MKPYNYLKCAILKHIGKLLNAINALYSTIFTKEIRDKFFEEIKSNMKFYNMSEPRKHKIKCKCMRKLFKRKIYNTGIPIHIRKPSSDEKRCYARIWGNGKIIKLEDGTIQYGDQCYRARTTNSDKYCRQHLVKNTHGNFKDPPSAKLILNYKKYSKAISKAIIK